jgi:hypothetical protein
MRNTKENRPKPFAFSLNRTERGFIESVGEGLANGVDSGLGDFDSPGVEILEALLDEHRAKDADRDIV